MGPWVILLFPAHEVKRELEEEEGQLFSPETRELIKGLGDSPESMALKAEILAAGNELKRGDLPKSLYFNIVSVKLLPVFYLGEIKTKNNPARVFKWISWWFSSWGSCQRTF